jgi:hypothetical protein
MGVFAGTERQCTEDEHDDEDENDSQISEFGINGSECDYRETQSDNSQRGCRLNVEDSELSCERQNADEYHEDEDDSSTSEFRFNAPKTSS